MLEQPVKSGLLGAFEALQWRAYRLFFIGNIVTLTGLWIRRLTIATLGWDLTHSLTWLGALAMADLVPVFLFGPIGGVWADKTDRLRIIFICQALAGGQVLILILLGWLGELTIRALILLTFTIGAISGLNQPARLAIAPSLAPPAMVASAVALNAIAFNLARFVGPVIAAGLIATAGHNTAFIVNCAGYLFFMAIIMMMRTRVPPPPPGPSHRKGGSLVLGFRYALADRFVGSLILVAAASSIFGRPFSELLAGLVEVFHGGAAELFGAMIAAIGAGAIVGAMIAGRMRGERILGRTVLFSQILLIGGVVLFVSCQDLGWIGSMGGIIASFLCGMAMSCTGVASQTLLHHALPDDLRGRVFAFYGMIVRGGPGLGAMAIGAASSYIGPSASLLSGCVSLACVTGWVWFARRHEINRRTGVP